MLRRPCPGRGFLSFPLIPARARRVRRPWFSCFCSSSRFAYCFRVSRCSCGARALSISRARGWQLTRFATGAAGFLALASNTAAAGLFLVYLYYSNARGKAALGAKLARGRGGELAASKTLASKQVRRKASSRFFLLLHMPAEALNLVQSRLKTRLTSESSAGLSLAKTPRPCASSRPRRSV